MVLKNTTAYISETFEPEVPDKLTYLAGFTKLKMNYNNEKMLMEFIDQYFYINTDILKMETMNIYLVTKQ